MYGDYSLVSRWLKEMQRDRSTHLGGGLGEGEGIGKGALVLHRGNRGQGSVDHSHYFIANEERSGHLPVACVLRVDGSMGRVR